MGFWSSAWDFVKSAGRTVAKVVKKVYDVLTDDNTAEEYEKLETIIKNKQEAQASYTNEPNFMGLIQRDDIDSKIHKQNAKLIQYEEDLNESKKIFTLQIELSRLRSSAELIDRSIKNVKMHASSLSIHYQNIRNINGLVEDINTLRYGLKAVISTINQHARETNKTNDNITLNTIENVNINKKDGAISQVASFDAFDRTRELLKDEIFELSNLAQKHLQDLTTLKSHAATIGGNIGQDVISFIDNNIIPKIKNAEKAGLLLKSEVLELPAAVRDSNGNLIFENGKIQLENLS